MQEKSWPRVFLDQACKRPTSQWFFYLFFWMVWVHQTACAVLRCLTDARASPAYGFFPRSSPPPPPLVLISVICPFFGGGWGGDRNIFEHFVGFRFPLNFRASFFLCDPRIFSFEAQCQHFPFSGFCSVPERVLSVLMILFDPYIVVVRPSLSPPPQVFGCKEAVGAFSFGSFFGGLGQAVFPGVCVVEVALQKGLEEVYFGGPHGFFSLLQWVGVWSVIALELQPVYSPIYPDRAFYFLSCSG